MQPTAHKTYHLLQEIIFATDLPSNHINVLNTKTLRFFSCPKVVSEKDKCILTYII